MRLVKCNFLGAKIPKLQIGNAAAKKLLAAQK